MGPHQPGQAPVASLQQIYRQLQLTVNEALRILDAAQPSDPANRAEVEGLRAMIWSDLTGLETEFGREEGPRPDRVERFFTHLLSNGDHIGQIEALGSALLGGAPPPSQPAPDSPVAGLHQLHGMLASIRRQWKQVSESTPSQPSSGPSTPPPGWKGLFLEEADLGIPNQQEGGSDQASRSRRITHPRSPAPSARRGNGAERLFDDLGLGGQGVPVAEPEAPRPRAVITFVVVFAILAFMAGGVIYLGLSSGPTGEAGALPLPTGTFPVGTASAGTPSPTATLNPAPPKLVVVGSPLLVPCPSSGETTQFVVRNDGGRVLTWSAKVNPVPGSPTPLSLSPTSGQLSGGNDTNTIEVTVQALVSRVSGTITVTSNGGTQTVKYQISGC